jgi:peroxiredoxin
MGQAFDPTVLPPGLPEPEDDGAADHLPGRRMPDLALPSSDGRAIRLDGAACAVVYAYPYTGRPGERPLTEDWDLIPGARGCTPEACGFRDHHAELTALGADVFGVSTQSTEHQRELVGRLRLPFPILSDAELRLTRALGLPTFGAAGHVLLRRLTMLVREGAIDHVWYPVFPPDRHAAEVLEWLRDQRRVEKHA